MIAYCDDHGASCSLPVKGSALPAIGLALPLRRCAAPRAMTNQHAEQDDAKPIKDPTGLITLLDDLLATGAQHPQDLLNGSPALVARISPGKPATTYLRARQAHRVLVAAIHALGRPRSDALRALYNLDPIPRNKKPLFTQTKRREKAAEIYNLSVETIRRHTEETLLEALAMEIDYRISRGDGTTWAVTPKYFRIFKAPHELPPPPPEFYRRALEQRKARGAIPRQANPRTTRRHNP